jgi:Nsp1-like protein
MDDIITRWASDLTKYQKEFKGYAKEVSDWDFTLVNNGEKIQKLYLDTFEAEKASNEIERQLLAVESQQDELEEWLNRYEGEVKEMFSRQMGQSESLAGPDQERERTYKLAEKLTQHLDEKSRDLSKMVKEINEISSSISKGAKPEDPVSAHEPKNNIRSIMLTQWTAESDCARPERTSLAVAVDRSERRRAPGKGGRGTKVQQQPRQPLWFLRDGRGGEFLQIVHGTALKSRRAWYDVWIRIRAGGPRPWTAVVFKARS